MQTDHGLFLCFDGVPRSGRTHQADALAAALTADGHDVVRVSMPSDPVPLAKTNLAWIECRVADYLDLATNTIRPALEAGKVVILDGGITSSLIRARAVMGDNAPMGMLYLYERRAQRAATVDAEWIITTAREGERKSPGFDCVALWRGGASSTPKGTRFPLLSTNGARRHVTYFTTAAHLAANTDRVATAFATLFAERMGPEWEGAVEETQEQRDTADATHRMREWREGDMNPLYGVVANWGEYSEATRLAIVHALPTREGVTHDFLRAFTASGTPLPEGAVGAALAAQVRGVDAITAS